MYCDNGERYHNSRYVERVLFQGPSPIIPFLLVVLLGLLLCYETLLEYYEFLFEVKESVNLVQETLPTTLIILIFVVILLVGFMNETAVTAVPVLLLFLIFLLQNEILSLLVLVLVISLLAMFYHPSRNYGVSNSHVPMYQSKPEERRKMELPFGLSFGVLCYLLMVGCLTACTVFSEDQNIWWSCIAFLLACVLFFNFSGRGNREWVM